MLRDGFETLILGLVTGRLSGLFEGFQATSERVPETVRNRKGLERNNLYNLTCMRPRSEGRGDTPLYILFRAGP